MNAPIAAIKPPEVKLWVRRAVADVKGQTGLGCLKTGCLQMHEWFLHVSTRKLHVLTRYLHVQTRTLHVRIWF